MVVLMLMLVLWLSLAKRCGWNTTTHSEITILSVARPTSHWHVQHSRGKRLPDADVKGMLVMLVVDLKCGQCCKSKVLNLQSATLWH